MTSKTSSPAALPLGTPAPMHREKQRLALDETRALLAARRATSGVLALNDPDLGAPYTVPLSYVYLPGEGCELGSVYFHGAVKGHKVNLVAADGRASFCVVVDDDVVQETFSTNYRSVMATGRLEVVRDDVERRRALMELGNRYSPDLPAGATEAEIDGSFSHTCVLVLRVEQMSGKESKALAAAR